MLKPVVERIGCHISSAGGVSKSIQRALDCGANTMQMFLKSNRQWKAAPIKKEEIVKFKELYEQNDVRDIVVHAAYLINIGSPNSENEEKSLAALIDELERCEALGLKMLVLHPGATLESTMDECLTKIARNLDKVFEAVKGDTMILLENCAGQGSSVGTTFEEIKTIMDQCKHVDRVGVCLDTCHMFAAGYDVSTREGYEKTMTNFEKVLGFKTLKAFHINGSKKICGSRLDRHECLVKGEIPVELFKWIMQDPRLKGIPKILETPDEDRYPEEIKLLRSYLVEDVKDCVKEEVREESVKKKKKL
jgi:deoxyribonuclease-4